MRVARQKKSACSRFRKHRHTVPLSCFYTPSGTRCTPAVRGCFRVAFLSSRRFFFFFVLPWCRQSVVASMKPDSAHSNLTFANTLRDHQNTPVDVVAGNKKGACICNIVKKYNNVVLTQQRCGHWCPLVMYRIRRRTTRSQPQNTNKLQSLLLSNPNLSR